MVCTGKVFVQPDRQVTACAALIEAGRETAANLAVVYCSRGVAYQARDKLEPATNKLLNSDATSPSTDALVKTEAQRNIWARIDARMWFVELVGKDFEGELALIESSLDAELQR
jgi:hypothetical protein